MYSIVLITRRFRCCERYGDSSQLQPNSFQHIYPGTVNASRQVKLAFRVGGPLIKVAVKPGDQVEKGQLLMQIDPRDFKDNIRVLEAQLAGAESQRKRAKRDFERAQNLFDQHVSATADFDLAKSAFDNALAGVQSIKAKLQIARHKLKETSLRGPIYRYHHYTACGKFRDDQLW